MHIKRCFILVLSLIMLCVCLGCGDKTSNTNNEYIFLPKTELHTLQDIGGFRGDYKYTYQYDSYGNIVKEEQYTKDLFFVRDLCIDTTYTYDENKKILKELIREEHFSTNVTDEHFVSQEGYNYFYNESGQLVKKDYIYISVVENEFCGYKYEYDTHGNCTKEIKYFSDGTEKVNFECVYDSNNNLIKKSYMSNLYDLHYTSEETVYSYDDNGRLIYSKTTYNEPTSKISHYVEFKYYYDELNRLVKEESSTFQDGEKSREEIRKYKDFVKIVLHK